MLGIMKSVHISLTTQVGELLIFKNKMKKKLEFTQYTHKFT